MRCWIVMVLLLAGVAHAEVRTSKEAGISIDIPSSWKLQAKGDVMVGESKDQAVGLMFWVIDKGQVKDALKVVEKQVGKVVTDQKWNKPVDRKLNGMTGFEFDGTGKIGGKPADVMVAVLGPTPTQKAIVLFAAVESAKLAEHKAELGDIFGSIKPVK